MYNVLEKLRAGERIEGKDKEIYDQGLVGILRDLHDQIDAAVADAYGWPADLSDDDILHRLVDLNRERAAEEARGHIRYLRPDYQNPQGYKAQDKGEQTALDIGPKDTTEKAPWPKSLPEQIAAVRAALSDMGEATPEQVARQFKRGRAGTVQPLLESLTALGQARETRGPLCGLGRWLESAPSRTDLWYQYTPKPRGLSCLNLRAGHDPFTPRRRFSGGEPRMQNLELALWRTVLLHGLHDAARAAMHAG